VATPSEVREACRRNDADCYRLARTLEPVALRAKTWAEVLMDELTRSPEPMSAALAYGQAKHRWGLGNRKTLWRALRRQERRGEDCVVMRVRRFRGVRGRFVLLWTRTRWRMWNADTWLSTRPKSPTELRLWVLKKAAKRGGSFPSDSPFRVAYTCAGCGRPGYKVKTSSRTTCSSRCRQLAYNERRRAAVTPSGGHP
jgi:hypothetical protein